jgi:hypothetical protein
VTMTGAADSKAGGSKATVVLLVVVAMSAGIFGGLRILRPEGPDYGTFRGTRLGMTANDVRQKFSEPAPGTWRSVPSTEDVIVAWSASKGAEEARFEFHEGFLVAVRARVVEADPETKHPPLEASEAVVRTREADDAGLVKITILARTCPTHAAEAARRAAGIR